MVPNCGVKPRRGRHFRGNAGEPPRPPEGPAAVPRRVGARRLAGPLLVPVVAATWFGLAALLLLASIAGRQAPVPAAGGHLPTAAPATEPNSNQPNAATDAVAAAVSVQEAFDDLPMDSNLPDPWRVSRDGAARVVALPTSVDRSVRISSDGDGAPAEACRPTPSRAGPLRVALDYRLGRPTVLDTIVIELREGSTPMVALLIAAEDGRIAAIAGSTYDPGASPAGAGAQASARGTFDAAAWRRVELLLTGDGHAVWTAHETSGADAGSGSIDLPASPSRTVDTVCLRSPAGSPAAWVAVDDLLIEG
jgi:hypothetical protein